MTAKIVTFDGQMLKGGHKGLVKGKGKPTTVHITGSGFIRGKPVWIDDPPPPAAPILHWEGTVPANASDTDFTTEVRQKKDTKSPGGDRDDPAMVSVTVDDSAAKTLNTYVGDAP
ncbi:MAG TPA: hypothetical protein VH120_12640 [Gemmataceae bacterium]|jgi:hypothetical protein|nr:hypothetical protein [Gemmataceae bacterium]